MAQETYIGVNGVSRKVKSIYIGIDNVARKVKYGYVGIGNLAKEVYGNAVTPPTLAPGNTWYKGMTNRNRIRQINIVKRYTPTGYETESWNAAADMDGDGNLDDDIKCYVDGSLLTIAGNGAEKILANQDSSFLFSSDGGADYWFNSLTNITGLSILNTSNVTNMYKMFDGCIGLNSLDVSSFDTSNVTNMSAMFSNCGLISLNVGNFDTSNVTDMSFMFGSSMFKNLNLSNFDTSNVTNMDSMFSYCEALTSLNLSSFDTSNVTNMEDMFRGSSGLTSLNISSFDTSNVTNMTYMFSMCEKLVSLDISNFDTSNVTNMSHMFSACSKLTTIYASPLWSTKAVVGVDEGSHMFFNCKYLVGGNGTAYNSANIDKTYARIDDDGVPGYFTIKLPAGYYTYTINTGDGLVNGETSFIGVAKPGETVNFTPTRDDYYYYGTVSSSGISEFNPLTTSFTMPEGEM